MANEIKVQVSLNVQKRSGSLQLINWGRSNGFQFDMSGTKGPVVGAVAVTDDGTDVDLTQLTSYGLDPGVAWLHNLSALYYVDVGIRDPDTGQFYPLLKLQPGRGWPVELSENLLEQYDATGTGTGTVNNKLHIRLTDRTAPEGTTVNVECSIFAR